MVSQLLKKKKRGDILLMLDFSCLERDEILRELNEIEISLLKFFRNHIGEENAANPHDVFEYIFGVSPEHIDIYKRGYWWNILKNTIRSLRYKEKCFIINRGSKLYVLKTQDEANKFKKRIDSSIDSLKLTKVKADEWVRKRKWLI